MDCLSSSSLTAIVKTVVETECFRCSPIRYQMFPWIPDGILCLPQLILDPGYPRINADASKEPVDPEPI